MCSSDLMPAADLVETCKAIAAENGSTITLTDDVKEGTKGAHVIYTDIWVSMGEPDSVWAERIKLLKPYQVNKEAVSYTHLSLKSLQNCARPGTAECGSAPPLSRRTCRPRPEFSGPPGNCGRYS